MEIQYDEEMREIVEEITSHILLCYPHIQLSLDHDDHQIIATNVMGGWRTYEIKVTRDSVGDFLIKVTDYHPEFLPETLVPVNLKFTLVDTIGVSTLVSKKFSFLV